MTIAAFNVASMANIPSASSLLRSTEQIPLKSRVAAASTPSDRDIRSVAFGQSLVRIRP